MTLVPLPRKRRPGPPRNTSARVLAFPDWRALRRYWLLPVTLTSAALVASGMLDVFGAGLPDESPALLAAGGWPAAALVVAMIAAGDALLLPAGAVMFAAGAVFGPVTGAALSVAGGLAGFAAAFHLGRRNAARIGRFVGARESAAADRMLSRHGAVAVLLTRPLPAVSGVAAFLAGASPLAGTRGGIAAALGTLPVAVLYALAGATAADPPNALAVALVVVLTAAAFRIAEQLPAESRPD